MNDHSHLLAQIERYKQAVELFGFNPDDVHWQSIAVLLANGVPAQDVRYKMMRADRGWFRDGIVRFGSDDNREIEYNSSLYLSPKGMPYFVGYGGHHDLYGMMFKVGQHRLDRAGWLHISDSRVDIHARVSTMQQSWLDRNTHLAGRYGWNMNPYNGGDTKAPVPLLEVEKFDVMPVASGDWARLFRRILIAQGNTPQI